MATFFLYMEGTGRGCNYTIGCNYKVMSFEAESMVVAVKIAVEEILGDGHYGDLGPTGGGDGYRIGKATLIEAARLHSIDLDGLRAEAKKGHDALKQTAAEAKERAEYERLQAKFG